MQQKTEASERKKGAKSLMQRNVTDFQHLLNKCYITEADLVWTMGLRDSQIPKPIEHRQSSVPEVFFKKTIVETIRTELKAKEVRCTINGNEYGHMLMKKMQKTPEKHTFQQLKFYSDLRKSKEFSNSKSYKSNKQFDVIPYKEKHEFPTFIKKEYLHKIHVGKNETESAFDGAQSQQPYSTKIRNKNYAFFQPIARARGRNKVALSALAWEMGLRNY